MNPEQRQMRHDDPDQWARVFIEDIIQHDREMKVELTKNGPDDLPNRVLYMGLGEEEVNLIMPMQLGGDQLVPAEIVAFCMQMARQQFGEPFMVGFGSEVYALIGKDERDVPNVRGVLTQRFKEGDPNVTEAIMMHVIHRRLDGSLRSISVELPFRYEDGSVTFGEALWSDSINDGFPQGAVIDAMAVAFGSEQN